MSGPLSTIALTVQHWTRSQSLGGLQVQKFYFKKLELSELRTLAEPSWGQKMRNLHTTTRYSYQVPMSNSRCHNLRILCLHEEGSNALLLKETLRKLGDRLYLNHGIDLVYVHAPLFVNGAPTSTSTIASTNPNDHRRRTWWESNTSLSVTPRSHALFSDEDDDASPIATTDHDMSLLRQDQAGDGEAISVHNSLLHIARPMDNNGNQELVGLDASLLLLKQIWRSSATIGILGIGQGASIGALLTLSLQQEASSTGKFLPPQFAVFINARSLLLPNVPGESISWSNTACTNHPQFLHLYSVNGTSHDEKGALNGRINHCEIKEAMLLHQQMGGEWHQRQIISPSTRRRHRYGHDSGDNQNVEGEFEERLPWIPQTDDLNRIGRFLVAQKKRLTFAGSRPVVDADNTEDASQLESQESAALVALQQTLHQTEEEVSSLIAKQIAAHPPKALMAVIQPSQVSGRPWDNLDRPPGGGAPCPPEFLLRRDKREKSQTRRRT